jgi:hypothetical protein
VAKRKSKAELEFEAHNNMVRQFAPVAARKDSNANWISAYCHCKRCLAELPPGESPETWARLSVGSTPIGWQVWCVRHDCNVVHVDYQGAVHPADLTAKADA